MTRSSPKPSIKKAMKNPAYEKAQYRIYFPIWEIMGGPTFKEWLQSWLLEDQETPTERNKMTVNEIAHVCHEANRAYCRTIQDNSQKFWDDAEDWQRDSAIKGVIFHLENPEAGPSASHDSWLKEKQADGWKFGEVKDVEKKEHPCYRPYDELPPEQQAKDFLFTGIVNALKGFLPDSKSDAAKDPVSSTSNDCGQVGEGCHTVDPVQEFNRSVAACVGADVGSIKFNIGMDKTLRRNIDRQIQQLKDGESSRERSLAITKMQEAVMWLGMDLKRIGETPNPYPNSKDPSNAIVDPTADGLKL